MLLTGNKKVVLEDIFDILYQNEKIEIEKDTAARVAECYHFLKEFADDKVIYGVNTGFGPMAQYRVDDAFRKDLQYNLIRSHTTGTGNLLPDIYIKSAMVARLNSLIQAFSGVHPEVTDLLTAFINHEIYPTIYEHGSVGASGDLVQLAHIALNLIGEGEVRYKGEIRPCSEVLAELGLNPIKMHIREGLSLVNGTSVMTGIGLINLIKAKQLLNWATMASAMINEIVRSYNDHFSDELNRVKHHPGQMAIARAMQKITADSKQVRNRQECLYDKKVEEDIFKDKVQEYYSLRCVPQILGPVYDTLNNAEEVLINELNSVNDNPIIDMYNRNVYHGGNFHGDYISFEMDKIKIAITKLTMLMERQLNYLFHDRINNILPPFVNLGKLGFNYGLQAAQFTATSTTAECQMLSNPMYVHSIPNNNDNQDIVSMGTNSALMAKMVIENSFQVMAIHYMAIVQAIDYLKIQNNLSVLSKTVYTEIREFFPVFIDDTPKYNDIKNVKNYLETKQHRII